MKELTDWLTVSEWQEDTTMPKPCQSRSGEIVLPKEQAAIIELVNGEGHVFRWDDDPENRKVCNGFKPPYTPTKWVYGRVKLQEWRNLSFVGEDKQYSRKLLGLTEESVVFETCEK
jgi:hypothetical protein